MVTVEDHGERGLGQELLASMDQWLGGFKKNELKSVVQNGGGSQILGKN